MSRSRQSFACEMRRSFLDIQKGQREDSSLPGVSISLRAKRAAVGFPKDTGAGEWNLKKCVRALRKC